jgi:hypothetical protein
LIAGILAEHREYKNSLIEDHEIHERTAIIASIYRVKEYARACFGARFTTGKFAIILTIVSTSNHALFRAASRMDF